VLAVYAPSEPHRSLTRSALDELTGKKILPAWTIQGGAHARVIWIERQVMARGGVAVKWVNSPGDCLNATQMADRDELVVSILSRLIGRHQPLYGRRAPSGNNR
jgi:hypothetical protein